LQVKRCYVYEVKLGLIMLNATELRNNTLFEFEGFPFKVLKYKHTHMGRGGANIRVKAKNLKTGTIRSFNFGSADKFEEVRVERKKMQFLYPQDDKFIFMDPKSFEQIEVGKNIMGEMIRFLKEGEEVALLFWQDEVLDIDMPASVVVEIVQTAPGVKGNSAVSSFKPAVASNGLQIKVPLFIGVGEKVKVDTRTGEYIERV